VVEGALIAARTVGADAVVIALKHTFDTEIARVRDAIERVRAAGWSDGIGVTLFEGPTEYPSRRSPTCR
jgi:NADH:ubiquinone oxidoreductase subunit F (NADH-binding)